jgi:hypothetical protein
LLLTLHYELIHFLIHTRVQPRTALYRTLWRNHRLHHFKSEHYWYGVTRIEGDWLLGTAPVAKDVTTSSTCRALLGEAPRGIPAERGIRPVGSTPPRPRAQR